MTRHMTRQEVRDQLTREMSVDAERMIDSELSAITISYDGCYKRAVAVIDTALGLRLLPPDRCDLLKHRAKQISQARKAQLEIQ